MGSGLRQRAPWWAGTLSFLGVLAVMTYALGVTRNSWCLAALSPVALAVLGVRGRLPGKITLTFDGGDPPNGQP